MTDLRPRSGSCFDASIGPSDAEPTIEIDDLAGRYRQVRAMTDELARPLSPEDQVVQSMPDVSPTKWHRAHTTWFFETFIVAPALEHYRPDPTYGFLFNSYYEAVGERHPRPRRGLITRPSVAEVEDYRRQVDEAMEVVLAGAWAERPEIRDLIRLGLHHEQQHQELLMMDIKHVLSSTIVRPAYRPAAPPTPGDNPPWSWVDHDGGIVSVGHDGGGFSFDNEGPVHEVLLRPYRLADRAVTVGDWLLFMDDGGYERAELWLSDGWHHVNAEGCEAPLYWRRADDGSWLVHTLNGERAVDPAEPIVHVSYYEADAFARWAGARLPTEVEWESATVELAIAGNLLPTGRLHPVPVGRTDGDGAQHLRQMYGDVWEWTSSPYVAYPGFRPAPGAVGEYNGKFMIDQQVLRGGSAVTPGGHIRPTYRNFFPARARWHFGGLRLASDR